MNEIRKRFSALIAAIETTRADVHGLLHAVNDKLADLPVRLSRTSEHDELVSTVSVLMFVAAQLDQATANLNRLKKGA